MQLIVDTSGLDALILRFMDARAALPGLMQQAAHDAGDMLKDELAAAAPVGKSEGPPPPGDASGRLADSFYVMDDSAGVESTVSVRTLQPLKLQYVTQGTGIYAGKGRIYPTTKKALYWPGASNPYRSVAGQEPNDFVTPVLDGFQPEEALQIVIDELAAIIEG